MKFTNKYNLHPYLFDWLTADDYDYNNDPDTMSATSLMKPVRASVLTTRYANKLKVDVTELIASRLGSSIHDSIEKISTSNVSKEQRVSRKVKIQDTEFTVTGKYDVLVFQDGKWILRDIKTTSVWAYVLGGKDEDYRKQLSIYRWLLSERHAVEDTAFIDFIFTDWQSVKAKQDKSYPQLRIKSGYKIDLLSLEKTEEYIKERLNEYLKYRNTPDDKLPHCTKKELWATDDTFAVMKAGNKRATKVCDSHDQAQQYIKDKNLTKVFIEKRPGKVKRCKYCSAAPFCNQFNWFLANNLIDF